MRPRNERRLGVDKSSRPPGFKMRRASRSVKIGLMRRCSNNSLNRMASKLSVEKGAVSVSTSHLCTSSWCASMAAAKRSGATSRAEDPVAELGEGRRHQERHSPVFEQASPRGNTLFDQAQIPGQSPPVLPDVVREPLPPARDPPDECPPQCAARARGSAAAPATLRSFAARGGLGVPQVAEVLQDQLAGSRNRVLVEGAGPASGARSKDLESAVAKWRRHRSRVPVH